MLPVPAFPTLPLPWFLFAWIPACSLTVGTGYVAPSKAFRNEPEHEARSPGCTPQLSHSRAVLPGRCHLLPCHMLRTVESVEAVSAGAHVGPQPLALANDGPRPGGISTKPASMRDPQEAEKERSVPTDEMESTAPEWLPLPPPPPRMCQDPGLKSPLPWPCLPENCSEAA